MKTQKLLALKLLDWHGGQGSSLYAVGSCMLSAADRGIKYDPANFGGHLDALPKAIKELENMKKWASFPECVTPKNETECLNLAKRLKKYLK